MKKFFIVSLTLIIGFTTANAQQMPMFGTYNYNKMLITPSAAGMDQKFGANLSSRLQFAGFEQAPVSNALSVDYGPEGKKFGVGLMVYSDQLGLSKTTGVQGNYAYRVQLTNDLELGLGLGLAFDQWTFDTYSMRPEDYNDPALFNANQQVNAFRGDAGLHIKWNELFVSFAVPKAYASDLSYIGDTTIGNTVEVSQLRHMLTYASYEIPLKDGKYSVTPSVLLRMAEGVDMQYDVNLGFEYTDKAYAMLAYRQGYAASIGAGVILNTRTRLGYSYDFPINNFSTYKVGSHEFYLAWRLKDKAKTTATAEEAVD
jgi:type IX secretion system PorP/SprF family membrane protein